MRTMLLLLLPALLAWCGPGLCELVLAREGAAERDYYPPRARETGEDPAGLPAPAQRRNLADAGG